jgi:hypothetical protein
MNAIYSSEGEVRSHQFRPDYANLFVSDFGSGPWLLDGENSGLATSIEFDYEFEREFARTLDRHSILWQYKPRTFAVEWDENGTFIDSFTPSFFLPARDLYIELVAPDCRLSNERARKARLLRQQHPAISIEVLPCTHPHQAVERLC